VSRRPAVTATDRAAPRRGATASIHPVSPSGRLSCAASRESRAAHTDKFAASSVSVGTRKIVVSTSGQPKEASVTQARCRCAPASRSRVERDGRRGRRPLRERGRG
jgi:hypothetical protein